MIENIEISISIIVGVCLILLGLGLPLLLERLERRRRPPPPPAHPLYRCPFHRTPLVQVSDGWECPTQPKSHYWRASDP